MKEELQSRRAEERAIMRAKGYLTIKEASLHVRRDLSTLYRAVNNEEIEGVRIGSTRYLKWKDLVEWMNRFDDRTSKLLGIRADKLPPVKEE